MKRLIIRVAGVSAVLVLLLGLFVAPASAEGLGIAPSIITLYDVLKGTERIVPIVVLNLDDEETSYHLGVEGGFSSWVSFYDGEDLDGDSINTITIPGKQNATVVVKFNVPQEAANGEYTGGIYAETIPDAQTEGEAGEGEISSGQTVVFRMESKVLLEVTGEQILTGNVEGIGLMDVEVGYPLRIQVIFRNTGNVIAQPVIGVEINKGNDVIGEIAHNGTGVAVGGRESIITEWPTVGKESGEYMAGVTVALDGAILGEKQIPFKILPEGALTPQGEMTNLSLNKQSATSANVVAKFENTGMMDVLASLQAEIYRDGELVNTIESEEALVKPREEKIFTENAKLEVAGDYIIRAFVTYNGKQTEAKELMITVLGDSGAMATWSLASILIPAISIFGVLVVAAIFIVLSRSRRRKAM